MSWEYYIAHQGSYRWVLRKKSGEPHCETFKLAGPRSEGWYREQLPEDFSRLGITLYPISEEDAFVEIL